MRPTIKKENVRPLFDSEFIRVYDLQYEEGKHYYNASRRTLDNLTAVKSEGEFKTMLPDAVTCVVVVCIEGRIPRLLLSKEYRYPAGQFLLSPPAGLLDPSDALTDDPILSAARRELWEETGLIIKPGDSLSIINPLLFSSPGMTDESNALVCAVVHLPGPGMSSLNCLSHENASGSECFAGFQLVSVKAAKDILKAGIDKQGVFYSVYTWVALMYFTSGLWRK